MSHHSFHVIFNGRAGTADAAHVTAEMVEELFAANGLRAHVDADHERELSERIEAALSSPAQIIVAAGGDGTITALAASVVGTEKSLAILPLGTVNALAKDLGVPLELEEAVAALARGARRRIDVGEVNGRVFLHKVVVGLIPSLAAGREHIRGRHDPFAKIGFMRYLFRRLARARRMAVSIEHEDGTRRVERVQAIAVASNSYDEGVGQVFSRHCLDRGNLTLYVLAHLTIGDFFRLCAGMMLGTWKRDAALRMESIQGVTIDTHQPMLKVMFDGEVESLHTPLKFSIRSRALSVFVPVDAGATEEAA